MTMTSSESIREAHEAFVSGHSGSTPPEVILAIYPAIPASVIAAVVGQRWPGWIGLMLEYILLAIPLSLSFTYLASYALELSAFLMAVAGIAVYCIPAKRPADDGASRKGLRYLTLLRGHLNLGTAILILAVDFCSFPRRLVKTEEYGYSLMDTGAAAFVVNNGIVEGRKQPSCRAVIRDGAILGALGILRFLLVRATDYQHHVTEYGVHANFFFTLAFVKITCSWWLWRLSCIQSSVLGIIIGISHQAFLVLGNGAAWTLSDAPRDTLISANREWFVAMPGYITIYFLGGALGDYMFNKSRYRIGSSKSSSLLLLTLMSLGILVALHKFVDLPSRRIANPTFIYFCVCFLLVVLTHYAIIEDFFDKAFPGFCFIPKTFQAINRQPLLFFLLANAATGLINKAINTLDIQYPYDLLIINGYAMMLICVVNYIFTSNIKLKVL